MRDVSTRPLGEVSRMLSGGTPDKSVVALWTGPIPWVSPKDMDAWILNDSEDHVAAAAVGNGTRFAPRGSTLMVVRSMTLANRVQIAYTRREVTFNQDIKAIVPGEEIDDRYLFYSLAAARPNIHALVDEASHGTKRLQTEVLNQLPIRLPPMTEQVQIAKALGALDDKIDLNRRTIQTSQRFLEVAFGRLVIDPGEVSPVPIEQLARIAGGSTPPTEREEYWLGGSNAWVTPKDLSRLQAPVLLDTQRRITEKGVARIGPGMLPAGTVLLSSRAPIGYLAISEIRTAVNQGIIAMVPNGRVSSHFLLHWAQHAMDDIKARANGTTFQEISKRNFRPMVVRVPSQDRLDHFDSLAAPIHRLTVTSAKENQTLTELRDLLLPKLISGEIRIRDAEKTVESAV